MTFRFTRPFRMVRLLLPAIALLVSGPFVRPLPAQEAIAPTRHVVLIGGLGGEESFTQAFRDYLFESRRAFVDRFGVPESNIHVLAEGAIEEEPFVDGISTAENIQGLFESLAREVEPRDQVYIILFGHGSFDGSEARMNIPRRDLSAADYAALLRPIEADRVVFVNTASASAPFIEALSGENRIVITATRVGSQRNATNFPRYFVEALTGQVADLDKDGALSIGEVFRYAAGETDRFFQAEGHLATEFALLDDNGDAAGHQVDELQEAADGALADVTYLVRALSPGSEAVTADPSLAPYLLERDDIERDIAMYKTRKSEVDEDAYYRELERLFVRLARLNERIEGGMPEEDG